jgi:hypothetical protein
MRTCDIQTKPALPVLILALLICVLLPRTAAAYPNMIRLGYSKCGVCHVSPQGAGVLTPYGRGIDFAQTLRGGDPPFSEWPEDAFLARLVYDARLSLGIDREPGSATRYGLSATIRAAVPVHERHRLVYAVGVRTPGMSTVRSMGAASVGMSRLYWMFRPKEDGLAIVVGRDDLPTGLQMNGANRSVSNPSVSSTPTQAKVFWWNPRWQVAAYAYGPDGNETQPQYEARGVGTLVAANVWRDRAVVGLTARTSKADAFDRRNAGLFVSWGVTEYFGVLAEHDITERTLNTGTELTHLTGHAEVFWVPANWIQTALAVEHANTRGRASTYRLSPSAEVRLTPNFRLTFSTRNVYAATDSREYSVQLRVKAQ